MITDYIKYNKQSLDYYYKNRDELLKKYKEQRLVRTDEEKENMRLYQTQYYYMVRKPQIQLQKKMIILIINLIKILNKKKIDIELFIILKILIDLVMLKVLWILKLQN